MWRAGPVDPAQAQKFKQARERLDLKPLVIHGNYLINPAADDPTVRAQSVAALRGEVDRALALGAEYLVIHPGSYGAQGFEAGVCALIESLRAAVEGRKVKGLTILIENTVGGGTKLGGCFEELKVMRDLALQFVEAPVAFCLDTAHCLASGYDIAGEEGLRHMVKEADRLLGLDHVKIFHANDSKTPLASHVDRHQHIGQGYIGEEGFRRILNHPKLRSKPFIAETPHDTEEEGRRNVAMLKSLCRKRVTTTKPSN